MTTTKEEVLESVDKRIETLKKSIEMLTKTIGDLVLADKADNKIVISEIANMIYKNRDELHNLAMIKEGNYSPTFLKQMGFSRKAINWLCEDSAELDLVEERLPAGVIAQINEYNIYEPIRECNFTIKFPEEYGILEGDVISYKLKDSLLTIKVRNNITCPLLKIDNVIASGSFKQIDIVISTLDMTGTKLYDVRYKIGIDDVEPYEISGGDYTSNDTQVLTLTFHVYSYEIIDRRLDLEGKA